ncbi:hypothetical protein [Streptomyces sp. NPDC002564]|uniref:hypothetical protein n=1 Tax=Streptomyces sp. NPDC002564 TaxID=3364649 RepID=UPI0036BC56BB
MQSHQDHTTPAPPPVTTGRPGRRTSTAAVWLAVGLLVGAGAVGAAWALDGGGASADGADAAGDARAACQALDGFDEGAYTKKGTAGEIAMNRFAAAGAFAGAAAAGDERYKPLAEAVRRTQERHARLFAFDAEAKRDLAEARGFCRDL